MSGLLTSCKLSKNDTQCLPGGNRAVTLAHYSWKVTIKQIIFGVGLGSVIVGLAVHRIRKEKSLQSHPSILASSKLTLFKAHSPKTASSKKHPGAKKRLGGTDTELSSNQLFG
jgi:hypothetical protein